MTSFERTIGPLVGVAVACVLMAVRGGPVDHTPPPLPTLVVSAVTSTELDAEVSGSVVSGGEDVEVAVRNLTDATLHVDARVLRPDTDGDGWSVSLAVPDAGGHVAAAGHVISLAPGADSTLVLRARHDGPSAAPAQRDGTAAVQLRVVGSSQPS